MTSSTRFDIRQWAGVRGRPYRPWARAMRRQTGLYPPKTSPSAKRRMALSTCWGVALSARSATPYGPVCMEVCGVGGRDRRRVCAHVRDEYDSGCHWEDEGSRVYRVHSMLFMPSAGFAANAGRPGPEMHERHQTLLAVVLASPVCHDSF